MRDPAPAAAQRVRGADDHGVAHLLDERAGRLGIRDRAAPRNRFADRAHQGRETLSVLARGDRLEFRAEQLDAMALQDSGVRELAAQVEGGLPAHPAQDPLRLSLAITFSRNSTVSGSTYTASAVSGSVWIVAGLLFTRTTRTPSSRRDRHAWVPE